jgi:hypothetical protein
LLSDGIGGYGQSNAAVARIFLGTRSMRIGKPLLITTTAIGLPIGIFEGFHLAGALGFVMVTLIALFGLGIAWIVRIVRAEQRAEREARGAPD